LEYNETVQQLFINFKEADNSVRREVLYNIFIVLRIAMKLDGLIKISLNETYSKVHDQILLWASRESWWRKVKIMYGP
jgi:hypothetical protein